MEPPWAPWHDPFLLGSKHWELAWHTMATSHQDHISRASILGSGQCDVNGSGACLPRTLLKETGRAPTFPSFFLLATTGVRATILGQEVSSREQRMADQLDRRDVGSR